MTAVLTAAISIFHFHLAGYQGSPDLALGQAGFCQDDPNASSVQGEASEGLGYQGGPSVLRELESPHAVRSHSAECTSFPP